MFAKTNPVGHGLALGVMLASAAQPVSAQSNFEIMGYDALVERVGIENVPTGENVNVVQAEGPTGGGDYGPNQNHSQFTGKTFNAMSGPPGSSSHATSVAGQFYGNTSSMAPGVEEIWLYEASHWIFAGFLRVNSGLPPLPPPGGSQVFNNSWIGSLGSDAANNQAMRRADWAIAQHNMLIVSGVANGGAGLPLMRDSYGGLAVGRSSGGHSSVATPSGIDGPGRMKPEIAAPGDTTSAATPKVASAAALLFDTVHTDPSLAANPDASTADVIKAVLLAGAAHSDLHGSPWTNNPVESGPNRGMTDQPLDNIVGAGTVNVNISHMILTGGQQPAASSPDALAASSLSGWDLAELQPDGSAYWRFQTGETAEEVSITTTWNRRVPSNFLSFTVATIELELWRVEESGVLHSLVGDAGLDWFAAGNVVSDSHVDNIQHLYIQDLQPGAYVLEARRVDGLAVDWMVGAAWHFYGLEDVDPGIPGDLNGDGSVGVADLLILLAAWGPCADCDPGDPGACPADLTGDCNVGVADLLILLANWG